MMKSHEDWMSQALVLADKASDAGEVPIGAVVVKHGELIAEGWNQTISNNDPTAHAETVAIRAAAKAIGNYRLKDCDLYVTVEPCAMCAGALIHSRIGCLFYGAHEPRAGAVNSSIQVLSNPDVNHRVEVHGGIFALEAGAKMSRFFRARRTKN